MSFFKVAPFLAASAFFMSATVVSFADEAVETATEVKVEPVTASEPAPAVPAPVVEAPAMDLNASAEATSTPGNVTVDFRDADIQNVIRVLSFKSGVNIVSGSDVQGNVTIRLVDVPWEKALDTILKTRGYGYDRRDNIIRVDTVENLKREDLQTEVIVLNYTDAAEAEKSIKGMLSDRGTLRSDKRTNSVVVTDMPTVLQAVRNVVSRLDQATPQVLIEAKVIEITMGDADRLGIKWNISAGVTGSRRPTTLPWPARQRTALSRFLPGGKEPQTSTVITPATFSNGLIVTAATTSTSVDGPEDFPQTDADLTVGAAIGATNLQPTFPVALRTDFTFGTIDFSQFSALLELIETRDGANILSEPHVVTLNNQEAKVLVGEIISIPKFERNSVTGRMEITGYTDRDLGVKLTVTPQINYENEIVVSIHPQITALLGYDQLTEDIRAPHFTTRETTTNVRIKSGQTIAIGGLIKEDTIDRTTKVPILGDLPLLQTLFRHTEKVTEKTDLLFFMTVTVLKDTVPQGHKI